MDSMLIILMLLVIISANVSASHRKVVIKVPQKTKHIYHHHVKRVPVYIILPQKKSKILEHVSYEEDQPTYISSPCKQKHAYLEAAPSPYKYGHEYYESSPSEHYHSSSSLEASNNEDHFDNRKIRHNAKVKQMQLIPLTTTFDENESNPPIIYKGVAETQNNNDDYIENDTNTKPRYTTPEEYKEPAKGSKSKHLWNSGDRQVDDTFLKTRNPNRNSDELQAHNQRHLHNGKTSSSSYQYRIEHRPA